LREIDIPACRVNAIEDLFDEPHLAAVGLFQEFDHPTEGQVKMARFPVRFSRSPASIRRLPPNLGEHTDAVINALSAANPEDAA
jgi:crotonobetainyl-CoA:carnitine CoA-transferase CaiB-like acyl-CoA transferase